MRKRIFFIGLGLVLVSASPSLAKITFPFHGQIDFLDKKYSFDFPLGEKGNISTQWMQSAEDKFDVLINVEHLQHSLLDLTTDLFGSIKVVNKGEKDFSLTGNIWSQNSLLNLKPSSEITGSFEIKEKRLFLNSVSLGAVTCQGHIDLYFPFKLNVGLALTQADIEGLLKLFNPKDDLKATGTVSGKIQLSGDIGSISLKGELQSSGGTIDQWEYETMNLNVEGLYPFIYLHNSQIVQSDGAIFSIEGPLNLADTKNFSKQFEHLTKSPLVNVSGAGKEWTFKRMKAEEDSGTTELKYLLRKNTTPGSTQNDDTDMFGLERTIEF